MQDPRGPHDTTPTERWREHMGIPAEPGRMRNYVEAFGEQDAAFEQGMYDDEDEEPEASRSFLIVCLCVVVVAVAVLTWMGNPEPALPGPTHAPSVQVTP